MRLPRQRSSTRDRGQPPRRSARERRPVAHRRTRGDKVRGRADRDARRFRTGLTTRAAILGVAVCAVVLTLAVPFQQYIAQRGQVRSLAAEERAERDKVASLQQAQARWRDPAYVRQQARERLHFVQPGETAYVIVDPAPPPPIAIAAPTNAPARATGPWYAQLWASMLTAGAQPASPAARKPHRSAEPKPITPAAQH